MVRVDYGGVRERRAMKRGAQCKKPPEGGFLRYDELLSNPGVP